MFVNPSQKNFMTPCGKTLRHPRKKINKKTNKIYLIDFFFSLQLYYKFIYAQVYKRNIITINGSQAFLALGFFHLNFVFLICHLEFFVLHFVIENFKIFHVIPHASVKQHTNGDEASSDEVHPNPGKQLRNNIVRFKIM